MKVVINNKHDLKDKDITEKIYRARAVIINSKNEILLGYCKNTYQFPGGYLEDGETMVDGLKREVLEETGIVLENQSYTPFYVIKHFNKDWPEEGKNRYTEFNYFLVLTDEKYNLENTNFDEGETANNYELRYVNLDNFEETLNESLKDNPKNQKVYPEMLDVIETYKKLPNNEE